MLATPMRATLTGGRRQLPEPFVSDDAVAYLKAEGLVGRSASVLPSFLCHSLSFPSRPFPPSPLDVAPLLPPLHSPLK